MVPLESPFALATCFIGLFFWFLNLFSYPTLMINILLSLFVQSARHGCSVASGNSAGVRILIATLCQIAAKIRGCDVCLRLG
jgi:hypothetical protein